MARSYARPIASCSRRPPAGARWTAASEPVIKNRQPAPWRRARRFLLSLLIGWQSACLAQVPPAPVQFEVKRFEVDGAWLLSSDRIDEALAPFVGPGRTIADMQQARAALEAAYARRGYGATQVTLPEQELKDGVVRLRVVEATLSRILVEGNRFFGDTNIRESLPALQTGAPLNTNRLAANLQFANENPAKQATVVLKPGARADEVEAEVRVADQRPYRFSLSLDNTGTSDTGDSRVGAGFQHANLFDRDQVLNLQYVTSPTQANDVQILGAGYHVPLYSLGDSIDLIAGYANVDSGVVQGLFNISGSGRIYAGRYNFGLPRFAGVEQKLGLGYDARYYDNNVVPVGTATAVVPDYVLHPLSLAYSGAWRGVAGEVAFYASGVRNIPGGSNGDQAQFDLVRPGAPADYTLSRFNFRVGAQLPARRAGPPAVHGAVHGRPTPPGRATRDRRDGLRARLRRAPVRRRPRLLGDVRDLLPGLRQPVRGRRASHARARVLRLRARLVNQPAGVRTRRNRNLLGRTGHPDRIQVEPECAPRLRVRNQERRGRQRGPRARERQPGLQYSSTNAHARSGKSGSGVATIAASATSRTMPLSALSISTTGMFSAPRMMTSLLRSQIFCQ